MHIQYNNYTVKCVYIYRFFIHIARYFCIKTGSGDFIPPSPPKQETPQSTSGLPEEAASVKSLRAAAPLHLRSMFWKGLTQNNTPTRTYSFQGLQPTASGGKGCYVSPLICSFLASAPFLNDRSSPSRKSRKTSKLCHTSFVITQ